MKINNYLAYKQSHKSRFGFTLVEIIVVIFIIASLASIGFGVFFKMRDSAKAKDTLVFMQLIKTNMEAVKAETGTPFPTDADELFSYLTGTYAYSNPEYAVKPFMPELLPDQARAKNVEGTTLLDSWGRELEYEYPGQKNNFEDGFDLKSQGIDPDEEADDIEL